jgi:hypothetical protein
MLRLILALLLPLVALACAAKSLIRHPLDVTLLGEQNYMARSLAIGSNIP